MSRRANIRGRACRRSGGFTLIEVLTAILVLSITIPVLMNAYSTASDVAAFARQRSEAMGIAKTHLEELTSTGDWETDNSPTSGEERVGDSPTSYQWQAVVNDWSNLDNSFEDTAVQQLTITVQWKYHGRDCELTLDTLVYDVANSSITTSQSSGGGITGGLP